MGGRCDHIYHIYIYIDMVPPPEIGPCVDYLTKCTVSRQRGVSTFCNSLCALLEHRVPKTLRAVTAA